VKHSFRCGKMEQARAAFNIATQIDLRNYPEEFRSELRTGIVVDF